MRNRGTGFSEYGLKKFVRQSLPKTFLRVLSRNGARMYYTLSEHNLLKVLVSNILFYH